MKIKGIPIKNIIARLNYDIEKWEAQARHFELDQFGKSSLCSSKQEKEYLELLQLAEEKRRLLTRIINWIAHSEKDINSIGKRYYANMVLDINVAQSMEQLDKIEKDWDESQRRQSRFED